MPGITGQPSQVQSGLLGLLTGLGQGAVNKQQFQREALLRDQELKQQLAERRSDYQIMAGGRVAAEKELADARTAGYQANAAAKNQATQRKHQSLDPATGQYVWDPGYGPGARGTRGGGGAGSARTPTLSAQMLRTIHDQAARDAFGVDDKGRPLQMVNPPADKAEAYNNSFQAGLKAAIPGIEAAPYYTSRTAQAGGLRGLLENHIPGYTPTPDTVWGPNPNWDSNMLGRYGQNAVPTTTTSPGANPPAPRGLDVGAMAAGAGIKPATLRQSAPPPETPEQRIQRLLGGAPPPAPIVP